MSTTSNKILLTLVIPCFGKQNNIVDDTVKSAIELTKKSSKIEVIFVYKNLNEFNYDWVKEKYSKDILVLKTSNLKYKKIGKLFEGIAHAKGKYIYPLDADDICNVDEIDDFVNNLEAIDSDLIIMNYIRNIKNDKNEIILENDGYKFSKNKSIASTNFNTIFSKESLLKIQSDYSKCESLLLNSDLSLAIFVMLTSSKKTAFINNSFLTYIKWKENTSDIKALKNKNIANSIEWIKQINNINFDSTKKINKNVFSKTFNRLLSSYWIESVLQNEKIDLKLVKQITKKMNKFMFVRSKCFNFFLFRFHMGKKKITKLFLK